MCVREIETQRERERETEKERKKRKKKNRKRGRQTNCRHGEGIRMTSKHWGKQTGGGRGPERFKPWWLFVAKVPNAKHRAWRSNSESGLSDFGVSFQYWSLSMA